MPEVAVVVINRCEAFAIAGSASSGWDCQATPNVAIPATRGLIPAEMLVQEDSLATPTLQTQPCGCC